MSFFLKKNFQLVINLVMTNLFPTDSDLQIHEKYDLKGSTVGRTAGKYALNIPKLFVECRVCVGVEAIKANPRTVRKDLDFKRRLSLAAPLAEHLAAQVCLFSGSPSV